jgi:hypothetical protein
LTIRGQTEPVHQRTTPRADKNRERRRNGGDDLMSMMMVRSKIKAESVAEVEAAARTMFSGIQEAQPQGVRYASCRLPDGVTFVALLELGDGVDNPLPTVPAFREFQENLKHWLAEPPIPEQLTVIGSYRSF